MNRANLPSVRSGERADFKRCKKKWYWAWRRGLVQRAHRFGALELGTWVHAALADWYSNQHAGRNRSTLRELFWSHAQYAVNAAQQAGAPEHVVDKAIELQRLGEAMMEAYQTQYQFDDRKRIRILAVEIPLTFTIPDPDTGELLAIHKFKPDAVFADEHDDVWLMEHKTAASIRTEHLTIDDQARPYGAMSERALTKMGILREGQTFKGILYNFMRKALPDERPQNEKGERLNKNGTVSKSQPPPLFLRKAITLTRKQKVLTLKRVQAEVLEMTFLTQKLRDGSYDQRWLTKTPHKSCPKTCDFFKMCEAEENGTDIKPMERMMFFRRNPYLYEEENPTADEAVGFEMG